MDLENFVSVIRNEREKFEGKIRKEADHLNQQEVIDKIDSVFSAEHYLGQSFEIGDSIQVLICNGHYTAIVEGDGINLTGYGVEIRKFQGSDVQKLYQKLSDLIFLAEDDGLPF